MIEIEYRYTLTRDLGNCSARYGVLDGDLVWIMLNPSTADETVNDATIRRVEAFTEREGYSTLTVVNLFAMRCTRPVHLRDVARKGGDPVGPANGMALHEAINYARTIVCAWGAWLDQPGQGALRELRPNVEAMIGRSSAVAWCLGTTASGAPRHPLYVKGDQPLVPFPL